MAFSIINRVKPLSTQLAAKADGFNADAQKQAAAAVSFVAAADAAVNASATADRHAQALQKALTILADAGVPV